MDRMDDLISRQAAIEVICEEGTKLERNGTVAMCEIKQWCIDLLERLPPVTLTYRQDGEKEGKMDVDVYVKWSKDGDFNRYHVTKGNIYTWMDFLRRAQENNIIEEFYMYVIEE